MAIAAVEQERAGVSATVHEVDERLLPLAILVPKMVGEPASPDGSAKHGHGGDPSLPSAGEAEVQRAPHAGGTEHLCALVEDIVEPPCTKPEEDAVHVIELVDAAHPGGDRGRQHE